MSTQKPIVVEDNSSDIEDKKALKRAAIEELYHRKRQKQNTRNSDEEDVTEYKSKFSNLFKILYNPQYFGDEITEIQTRPQIPDNMEDVININEDNINKIRFKIDDNYTKWYDWDSSQLENIIKYYADGNISRFLSKTSVNYIVDEDQVSISVPEKYNSRSSRLKKELKDRVRLIGENIYEPNCCQFISAIYIYLSILMIYLTSSYVSSFGLFISVIVITCSHFMIGLKIQRMTEEDYTPREHYKAPFKPGIYILLKIFKRIDRID